MLKPLSSYKDSELELVLSKIDEPLLFPIPEIAKTLTRVALEEWLRNHDEGRSMRAVVRYLASSPNITPTIIFPPVVRRPRASPIMFCPSESCFCADDCIAKFEEEMSTVSWNTVLAVVVMIVSFASALVIGPWVLIPLLGVVALIIYNGFLLGDALQRKNKCLKGCGCYETFTPPGPNCTSLL